MSSLLLPGLRLDLLAVSQGMSPLLWIIIVVIITIIIIVIYLIHWHHAKYSEAE